MNKRYMFAAPFIIFMLMMVVFPLVLLFWYAFTSDYYGGFTFGNFGAVFGDGVSMRVLGRSIWIALLATGITLAIAYPIAYGLTMTGFKKRTTILLLFTLPMWTNLLLRSIAIRNLYMLLGISTTGFFPLLISFVINFLPLAILPLFVVLGNIDKKHIEASQDLGAGPLTVFRKTVFPLSIPGLVASFILIFSPIVSTYFLSHFFGGNDYLMFGWLLNRMFIFGNIGHGAVLSLLLLALVGISVLVLNRFSKVGNKRGGLW